MTGRDPRSSAVVKSPPSSPLPLDSYTGLGLCFPCVHPLDREAARIALLPRWGLGTVGRELKREGASPGI